MKLCILSFALLCALVAYWLAGHSSIPEDAGDAKAHVTSRTQSATRIPVQAKLAGSIHPSPIEFVRISPAFSKEFFCIPPQAPFCPPEANLEPSNTPPVLFAELPKGVALLSLKAPVTSSCPNPFTGTLELITDGDKKADFGYFVELDPGKQWVQIDLGASFEIWAVWVWHYFKTDVIYQGVAVQVSDDPTGNRATMLFNNDYANVLGMGVGTDPSYVETRYGRCIQGYGTKGRYIRLWSCGYYASEMNHYIEVEVYGK